MKKSIGPRFLSKTLSFYYGHPAKDMKLIVVATDNPSSPLPVLIQSILATSGAKSAVIRSTSLPSLHRSLSKTWKNETDIAILASPLKYIHNLPVHILVADQISSPAAFLNDLSITPSFLVLNRDDLAYPALKDTPAKVATKSFGHHREADTRIDSSKYYKTAVEARLAFNNQIFDVAAFLTGSTAASLLAASTAVADLLGISRDVIIDGLASYEP